MTPLELSARRQTPEPDAGRFNYKELPADLAGKMKEAAADIRRYTRDAFFEVGKKLLEIKDRLDHGQFVNWVETECALSIRTAQRAMQVAELKSVNLTYLPARSLLLLAGRSTPSAIRDEIIQRIDAGDRPTATDIEREIQRARATFIQNGRDSGLGQREAREADVEPGPPVNEAKLQLPQAFERSPESLDRLSEEATATLAQLANTLADAVGDTTITQLVTYLEAGSAAALARALRECRPELFETRRSPDLIPAEAPNQISSAISAEELTEIVKGLKPNAQLRAVRWVECDSPDPEAWDESIRWTEVLADFRKAAGQASKAELDRFLDQSLAEGWRQPMPQAA